MSFLQILAYLAIFLAVPASIYAIVDGVRKQRRYRATQMLADQAIDKAEKTRLIVADASVALDLAQQKIKEQQGRIAALEIRVAELEESNPGE